jgi:hypothetical protein
MNPNVTISPIKAGTIKKFTYETFGPTTTKPLSDTIPYAATQNLNQKVNAVLQKLGYPVGEKPMFYFMRNCINWRPFNFVQDSYLWVEHVYTQVFPFLRYMIEIEQRTNDTIGYSEDQSFIYLRRSIGLKYEYELDTRNENGIKKALEKAWKNKKINKFVVPIEIKEKGTGGIEQSTGEPEMWMIFYTQMKENEADKKYVKVIEIYSPYENYESEPYISIIQDIAQLFPGYILTPFQNSYSSTIQKEFNKFFPEIPKKGFLTVSSAFYMLWGMFLAYMRICKPLYNLNDLRILSTAFTELNPDTRVFYYTEFAAIVDAFSRYLAEQTFDQPEFKEAIWNKCGKTQEDLQQRMSERKELLTRTSVKVEDLTEFTQRLGTATRAFVSVEEKEEPIRERIRVTQGYVVPFVGKTEIEEEPVRERLRVTQVPRPVSESEKEEEKRPEPVRERVGVAQYIPRPVSESEKEEEKRPEPVRERLRVTQVPRPVSESEKEEKQLEAIRRRVPSDSVLKTEDICIDESNCKNRERCISGSCLNFIEYLYTKKVDFKKLNIYNFEELYNTYVDADEKFDPDQGLPTSPIQNEKVYKDEVEQRIGFLTQLKTTEEQVQNAVSTIIRMYLEYIYKYQNLEDLKKFFKAEGKDIIEVYLVKGFKGLKPLQVDLDFFKEQLIETVFESYCKDNANCGQDELCIDGQCLDFVKMLYTFKVDPKIDFITIGELYIQFMEKAFDRNLINNLPKTDRLPKFEEYQKRIEDKNLVAIYNKREGITNEIINMIKVYQPSIWLDLFGKYDSFKEFVPAVKQSPIFTKSEPLEIVSRIENKEDREQVFDYFAKLFAEKLWDFLEKIKKEIKERELAKVEREKEEKEEEEKEKLKNQEKAFYKQAEKLFLEKYKNSDYKYEEKGVKDIVENMIDGEFKDIEEEKGVKKEIKSIVENAVLFVKLEDTDEIQNWLDLFTEPYIRKNDLKSAFINLRNTEKRRQQEEEQEEEKLKRIQALGGILYTAKKYRNISDDTIKNSLGSAWVKDKIIYLKYFTKIINDIIREPENKGYYTKELPEEEEEKINEILKFVFCENDGECPKLEMCINHECRNFIDCLVYKGKTGTPFTLYMYSEYYRGRNPNVVEWINELKNKKTDREEIQKSIFQGKEIAEKIPNVLKDTVNNITSPNIGIEMVINKVVENLSLKSESDENILRMELNEDKYNIENLVEQRKSQIQREMKIEISYEEKESELSPTPIEYKEPGAKRRASVAGPNREKPLEKTLSRKIFEDIPSEKPVKKYAEQKQKPQSHE